MRKDASIHNTLYADKYFGRLSMSKLFKWDEKLVLFHLTPEIFCNDIYLQFTQPFLPITFFSVCIYLVVSSVSICMPSLYPSNVHFWGSKYSTERFPVCFKASSSQEVQISNTANWKEYRFTAIGSDFSAKSDMKFKFFCLMFVKLAEYTWYRHAQE